MIRYRSIAEPWLVLGLLAMSTAGLAQVVEVIDQMPTQGYSGGFIADTECTTDGPLLRASFADDFRVQPSPGYDAMAISRVEFIGRYESATAPNDPTPFILRFHADAGGLPGTVVTQPSVSVVQTQVAPSVYRFSATFQPVTLSAGVHWLELVEDGNATTDCMQWVIGPLDAANGRDGSAHDPDFDGDLGWFAQLSAGEGDNAAFRIEGTNARLAAASVPTLTTWALWLSAALMAGLGMARARR